MYGITYKDKHSYRDFGLTIKAKDINPPKKTKIKETVPYMNGAYDFSNLYGEQTYGERTSTYTFNLNCKSKIELNIKKIEILDWLLNSFKTTLKDDTIPDFYFNAECENVDFKEDGQFAEITASFVAYPFKIANNNEGNDVWDTFNFELDYAQDTKFAVTGTKDVELYNLSSRKVTPTVVCSADFDVIQGNTTYHFKSGTTKDWRFTLEKGLNSLTLNGNGNIEFVFRKEVL